MRRGVGFTLIEILVVLFIISIVTSFTLLTISHNKNQRIDAFVSDLTQSLSLAEEQAMLQSTVLGLSVDQHSLQFVTYQSSDADKQNHWRRLEDKNLNQRRIPNGIEVAMKANNAPQIIISSNGDMTPFCLYVGEKGEKPRYRMTGEADGSITTKMLS